ncbi:MAG: hypothetical protein IIC81_01420 [Chloroflexi bacterium]|nr:hypothetical protein [Chloroflexota bacterium]
MSRIASRKSSFVIAAVLILTLVFSLVAVGAGKAPDEPPGRERAIAAKEAHIDRLLAQSGILGAGVGLDGGEHVVKVYTESRDVTVPRSLDGVRVVTQTTGKIVARTDPKAEQPRPVPIGVSGGSDELIFYQGLYYCTVGTIGARVIDDQGTADTSDDVLYTLSNNHVYALENTGDIGDSILQPGRVDLTGQACGTENERNEAVIGALADFEPIKFRGNASNKIDAAIATIDFGDFDGDGTSELAVGNSTPTDDGYGTPSSDIVSASLGQAVQKYGRTTKLTTGVVTATDVSIRVAYFSGTARFNDQIEVCPTADCDQGDFSMGGDSGSLIVTNDGNKNAVGLLFAGGGSSTFANRIDLVLAAFGVAGLKIDGVGTTSDTIAPDKVTGLTVTTNGSSQLDLAWAANNESDLDNYNIYRDSVFVTTSTTNSYSDTGLNAATTYTYEVSAVDTSTNEGTKSDAVSGTTDVVSAFSVTGVDPNNGNTRDQFVVQVSGSGFQSGATVDFGQRVKVQNVTFVSATQLDVQIKVHPKASSGSRTVTVTNPDNSSASCTDCFTVN